jgi:hypothetical protein
MKARTAEVHTLERAREPAPPERPRPARQRYATDAAGRTPRAAFNGLPALGADDLVNIVVKPARDRVGVARV